MSGIQWILVGMVIVGFLPMAIVIYKMRLVKKILNTGVPATATVYKVLPPSGKRSVDIVYYSFIDREGAQYAGSLNIKPGTYRVRDTVEIWYLPYNPRKNTVKGAWASPFFLIFVIVIALFVLFAAYKINETVQTGAM